MITSVNDILDSGYIADTIGAGIKPMVLGSAMSMPSVSTNRSLVDAVTRVGSYVVIIVLLGILVVGIAASPLAFVLIDNKERDWERLSTIGQAYGSVSALLSAAALCLVILLQRHQVRHERISMIRDMHMNVVGVALEEPGYAQCWGPRVATADVDERLFYYTSLIIMLWWYSWELGELRDGQVHGYARAMFDSEVPRRYWQTHGEWRLSGARGRRRRFLLIIDEEFQAAVRAGPPTRTRERMISERPGPRALRASSRGRGGRLVTGRRRTIPRAN